MGYKQAPQRLCDAKICRAEAPTQNDLGRPEIRVKRADSIFLIDIASTSHAYRTRGFSSRRHRWNGRRGWARSAYHRFAELIELLARPDVWGCSAISLKPALGPSFATHLRAGARRMQRHCRTRLHQLRRNRLSYRCTLPHRRRFHCQPLRLPTRSPLAAPRA